METLQASIPDDSSGANPSSVKSDDSSPRHESGRGSPPPNCAICLGTCKNKSFTDSCLHQFCFTCLLKWSKVKAECPLCKQNFKSIIHNVRSNHQYEEYMVEQRHTEEITESINIDDLTTATRRFRYRTTLTLPRRESIAIQQLLLHYPMLDVFPPQMRVPPPRRRRSPSSFRRTVYRHNLWARPLPDFTGRFRDCSPQFYRYNDSQMHRLVPWLNRELQYLLNENVGHISYVMTRILELLPQYHIISPEFREAMQRYFGDRTGHFLHELYCFAATPYDMTGYDRHVQYTTDSRISTMVNEVISSSDSDASVDSDIMMVSSSAPSETPPAPVPASAPGPSTAPVATYPHSYIPLPPNDNVIPIETISHSDTDDDSSEVMVVGYIKPPQDRTPEVVDLLGSDSDVIVQDIPPPEPGPSAADASEYRPSVPLVKLSLKRHSPSNENRFSDSDGSCYTPPPLSLIRKRRRRSAGTATTSDTCRTTPSPAPSWQSAPTPPSSDDSLASSTGKKKTRKKSRRKEKSSEKERKKSRKRKTRSRSSSRDSSPQSSHSQEKEKRNKRKSHSGKGVKSSRRKRARSATPAAAQEAPPADVQPGTSHPASRKSKSNKERKHTRTNKESKRLKSVVNVMNYQGESSSSGNSNLLSILNSAILNPHSNVLAYNSDSGSIPSIPSDDRTNRVNDVPQEVLEKAESCFNMTLNNANTDSSDSEDDLPLNLSVHKKTYLNL